ncbi:MAG: c-type cytochrome [Telluria sp.]|nr:c-type cytochrome [Telluria sp.]
MTPRTTGLVRNTVLATLLVAGALGTLAGVAFSQSGWYNVASTVQHWQPVHTLLEHAMWASVRRHARDIEAPPLDLAPQIRRGVALYRDKCVQCHGAPGVAPDDAGKSMQPAPGPLVQAARRWRPREMYWITRNGIKMSGMPAWQFHMSDEDIWAVVAFLTRLPQLSPQAYAELSGAAQAPRAASARASVQGNRARGRVALSQYACNSCHKIPGVTGPDVHIGPPLAGIAERQYIAGSLPNSADNLARWIRHPQQVDPLSAMPNLDVTQADAQDMVAYLLDME